MQQFHVPPLLPEPFEISEDPWSLDDIVNQNMSQEKPVPVQQFEVPPLLAEPFEISEDPWCLDDIVNQNMSDCFEELDRLLQTN